MITLESAIKSLKSQVPEAKPLAYWQKENEFVFVCDMDVAGIINNYFRVTNDGQILATNPMLSDLDEAGMIAIDQKIKMIRRCAMSTFLRKLSSRKLWAAIAAVVCSLAVAISGSELTPEVVTALQSAVGALVAYIFGEGAVDVARLVMAAKTTTEESANDR